MSSDIVVVGCLVHVEVDWNMKVDGEELEVGVEPVHEDTCVFSEIVKQTLVI